MASMLPLHLGAVSPAASRQSSSASLLPAATAPSVRASTGIKIMACFKRFHDALNERTNVIIENFQLEHQAVLVTSDFVMTYHWPDGYFTPFIGDGMGHTDRGKICKNPYPCSISDSYELFRKIVAFDDKRKIKSDIHIYVTEKLIRLIDKFNELKDPPSDEDFVYIMDRLHSGISLRGHQELEQLIVRMQSEWYKTYLLDAV
jgi:hypothetical protein